ncbi:NAD(P)-dependent oxidoreductase [Rhizobium sp. YS-1r]|uniref:NAD-dependent epimerase/dehydratase family protein n=1 Tax=Rhizobium sp. YS-1r TaxID=1532558 RepID=UPI00068D80F7|nr:NAD(P)-dependent oxidoreductase [Rhizobium sp. YS-1r]
MTNRLPSSVVLVTGACGFVGSAICEELVSRNITVIGADHTLPRFPKADWAGRVTFVYLDIRDSQAIAQLLHEHAITHIVHAAAITPDMDWERKDADTVIDVNVTASCRVMMAAREIGLERIIYLSSISAYGSATPTIDGRFCEIESIPKPETLYGISKHAAEGAMRRLAYLNGLDLRIIRLGALFGPWELATDARSLLSPHHQIAMQARAGKCCLLPRAVHADWLYSRDAAKRIADVLLAETILPQIFNLGGGRITSLIDWCEALGQQIDDFRFGIIAAAPTVRYGYPSDRPALDNRQIDQVSAHRRTSLEQAARELLHWLDRFSTTSNTSEIIP